MKNWVSAKSAATVALTYGFIAADKSSTSRSLDKESIDHHDSNRKDKKVKFVDTDLAGIPDPTSTPLPAEDRQEKIMWARENKAAFEKQLDDLMEDIEELLIKEKEEMRRMEELERDMKEMIKVMGKGKGKQVDRG